MVRTGYIPHFILSFCSEFEWEMKFHHSMENIQMYPPQYTQTQICLKDMIKKEWDEPKYVKRS